MKTTHLAAQFALSGLAAAFQFNASTGIGPGPSPNLYSPASPTQNASSSISFNLLYASYRNISANQWSWSINVTEFAAYNAEGVNSNDARLTNTIYSFTWPDAPESAETLPQKLDQYTAPQSYADGRSINATNYCVTVAESFFPANVTDAWDARSDSCISAIGVGCYNALLKEWRTGKADYDEQGCRKGQDVDVNGIPECYGTFGEWNATTLNLATSNATINNGSAFYHKESAAYDGANSTIYDAEVLRLHMLIVDGGDFQIACQRVNATRSLTGNDAAGAAQPGAGTVVGVNVPLVALAAMTIVMSVL